ncbi:MULTISPECIES: methylthioribulose 1-phosphate dehydratase [Pseudoalteromonas]|uniref:Methylthioribulose-1-phosphate dehydratase n=1 Tax=Pseudoalteromonas maricaloris TaxID=184924 RepID=A0A8I2H6H3_9GAMM|nr:MULTISPECIES: methylthioribulose 1-phosphate dehydratase [Pseudoalteromonas]NLR22079.1 methylthioribulose 1-phosphate dehydratase [Pseudoalteromonas maricaloris]RZG13383.1 methylthioribulose 1-phosphate dehydratase [Pseudoalteromonas sp. CO342X]WOX28506.1 methylthioribulose 1-phosphate dehydratase [Pseudoalteromonas maricaloris]
MHTQAAKLALIDAGAWVAQQGWVPATGGNFSIKTDSGFVVTASGFDKGKLTPEQFLELDATGTIIAGSGKPSAETALHLKLYELCVGAQCILHTHSVAATVLSRFIQGNQFQISGYEMQKSLSGIQSHEETLSIAIFDNDQDIERLAQRVAQSHQTTPVIHGVLIRGHGLYAVGRTVQETRRHIEGLEFLFACELERIKLEGRQ